MKRFWDKVWKQSEDDCWIWTGGRTGSWGLYGYFWLDGKMVRAHRYSFYLANGYYPPIVMHTCNNRCCVNPKHLKAGTQSENIKYASDCGRLHVRYRGDGND